MSIEDIETIQRRKQERYDVSFPCRVGLMGEGERPMDPLTHPLGLGKMTDISLGGVEFETELELTHGACVKLDVRGRRPFGLAGEIVRVLVDPSGEAPVRCAIWRHGSGLLEPAQPGDLAA